MLDARTNLALLSTNRIPYTIYSVYRIRLLVLGYVTLVNCDLRHCLGYRGCKDREGSALVGHINPISTHCQPVSIQTGAYNIDTHILTYT